MPINGTCRSLGHVFCKRRSTACPPWISGRSAMARVGRMPSGSSVRQSLPSAACRVLPARKCSSSTTLPLGFMTPSRFQAFALRRARCAHAALPLPGSFVACAMKASTLQHHCFCAHPFWATQTSLRLSAGARCGPCPRHRETRQPQPGHCPIGQQDRGEGRGPAGACPAPCRTTPHTHRGNAPSPAPPDAGRRSPPRGKRSPRFRHTRPSPQPVR